MSTSTYLDKDDENNSVRKLKARISILEAALIDIANWPDGGSRYGQMNIKKYAKRFIQNRIGE